MKLKSLLLGILLCGLFSVTAAAYTDVPADHWAASVISGAAEAGIMQGRDDGSFGLGHTITRSEFAAMLTRMMQWEKSTAAESPFSDVTATDWFFADVNTLAERAVYTGARFRPAENITRREMAVMLVKALDYTALAEGESTSAFADVTADSGYISVAHTLGIINGKSAKVFDPEGSALREEGAAMMMRLYEKYTAPLAELHGFYAISSWAQRDIAAQMDAVSFGWSRLQYTESGEVFLNLTSEGGNDWCVPAGAEDAIAHMRQSGVKINLAVTMTEPAACEAILTSRENRAEAIEQLIAASADYDGITVDFEGMKGERLKEGLTAFARELRAALGDRLLYVAVHPVLQSGEYFDAYDYRALGEAADRVILMAHDYAAQMLPAHLLRTDFIATPVTPFAEVYTALKAITHPETGVSDTSKVQLAISTASTTAWNTQGKQITDGTAMHPAVETVAQRLAQPDTELCYANTYKNPYAWYTTEAGQQILLWYEDSRSVRDKIDLAKMFGIRGVSIWRIGAVPDGDGAQYMDVWSTILAKRQ